MEGEIPNGLSTRSVVWQAYDQGPSPRDERELNRIEGQKEPAADRVVEELRLQLMHANMIIEQQRNQILKLERHLLLMSTKGKPNEDYPADGSASTMPNSIFHNNNNNRSSSGALRRRAHALEVGALQRHGAGEGDIESSSSSSLSAAAAISSTSSSSPPPPWTAESEYTTPRNPESQRQLDGKSSRALDVAGKSTTTTTTTDISASQPSALNNGLILEHHEKPVTTSALSMSSASEQTEALTPSSTSGPPKGLAARLAMGSQERRRLGHSRSTGRLPSGTSPALPSESPSASAAGASSSSSSVSSSSSSSSSFRHHGGGSSGEFRDPSRRALETDYLDTASVASNMSALVAGPVEFYWKSYALGDDDEEDAESDPFLFVAHDNPQVGETVAMRLKVEGPMHVMLESKEDSGVSCFVLGTIVHSGRIEGVEGVDLSSPRGSQFIVCHRMSAFRGDIKAFPTRAKGDISEIDLGQSSRIEVSTKKTVAAFLRVCTTRVDVILDPSHSEGLWYPYWEGRRKMAPQFRSQGVGYLRLGDDMSRYGTAFLSLDAGVTYLDDGATSIVADRTGTAGAPSSFSGKFGNGTGQGLTSHARRREPAGNGGGLVGSRRSIYGDENENGGSAVQGFSRKGALSQGGATVVVSKELDDVREALQFLNDPEYKWAERVEALRRLHNAIINISSTCNNDGDDISCNGINSNGRSGGSVNSNSNVIGNGNISNYNGAGEIPSSLLIEILSSLNQNITKQKNPHVLRSAVCCVRVVGGSAAGTASCGVAWRTLLLETIHLLRVSSKPVYEEAIDTLICLHRGAAGAERWTISLQLLLPMLEDVLAGPRGKGSGGASSSSKVIKWLESVVIVEIDCYMDLILCLSRGQSPGDVSSCRPNTYDKLDCGLALQKFQPLLFHREEASREAAVGVASALVAYDVTLTNIANNSGWDALCDLASLSSLAQLASSAASSASPASLSTPKNRDFSPSSTPSTLSTSEHKLNPLFAALSASCATSVGEMSKAVPRMFDRILSGVAHLLTARVAEARKSCSAGSSREEKVDGKLAHMRAGATTTTTTTTTATESDLGVTTRYLFSPSARGNEGSGAVAEVGIAFGGRSKKRNSPETSSTTAPTTHSSEKSGFNSAVDRTDSFSPKSVGLLSSSEKQPSASSGVVVGESSSSSGYVKPSAGSTSAGRGLKAGGSKPLRSPRSPRPVASDQALAALSNDYYEVKLILRKVPAE